MSFFRTVLTAALAFAALLAAAEICARHLP